LQESRRDLHDVANKHAAWEKKEKKKKAKTRTTKDQPLWCVSIVCETHSSLSDHALFPRYIWEDELVDYEGQAEKEAAMATADPEKDAKKDAKDAKDAEKKAKKDAKDTKDAEKKAKKNSSSSSSTKPSTTTRKTRLTFDEED
jgi:hypothetical protein